MAKKSNPLGRYGYPSPQALRKQALDLAHASVPSARQTARPFNQSIGDVTGFTTALLGLLRGTQGAGQAAYQDAIGRQQTVDAAARARLSGLGPGLEGAEIAAGARGDSAMSRLIAGQASTGAYEAAQPGIVAGRGALAHNALVNARSEALAQRHDAVRQAFTQAYDQVQQRALALFTATADIDFRERDFAHRQAMDAFDRQAAGGGGGGGGKPPGGLPKGVSMTDYRMITGRGHDLASQMYGHTKEVPNPAYIDPFKTPGVPQTKTVPDRPPWSQALTRLRAAVAGDLRRLGFKPKHINQLLRQMLVAAGFSPPPKPSSSGAGPPYDWQ